MSHPPSNSRSLFIALTVTLGFAAIEALGGWWSGSLALLGDAGHMLTDSMALGIAALAAVIARRPPSHRHSYGLGRAEVIAALFNSLVMVAIVIGIVSAAIDRLQTPQPVAGGMVLGIAALGLAVNIGVALLLSHAPGSLNTRAALLHVMGDLLGSLAALLAGAVILLTGWTPIDPILSMVICALILFSSLRLLRDVLHVIMEGVPAHLDLPVVGRAMAAVSGVTSVHDLHIWTLSSGQVALSAHIVIEDMTAWDVTLGALRTALHDDFDIDHITLQPEIAPQVIYRIADPDQRHPASR